MSMRKFEPIREEMRKGEIDVKLPTRASKYSAGYDFYSPIDIIIKPHTSELIFTNVKAMMQYDEVLLLAVRSSMGKVPIMLANNLGVVDCDYYSNESNDGNVGFRLYNASNEPYEIKVGDKIGQGMFMKYYTVDDDDSDGIRTGGYGSSGQR